MGQNFSTNRRFPNYLPKTPKAKMIFAVVIVIYVVVLISLAICAHFQQIDANADFKCGVVSEQSSSLIINGTEAPLGFVPWYVAVKRRESRIPNCGATIISSQWVVTAAHCHLCLPTSDNPDCMIVVAGSQSALDNSAGTVHNVIEFHPFSKNDTQRDNDIALMRVDPPFQYRKHGTGDERAIGPVCLPEAGSKVTETDAVTSGLGGNSIFHETTPSRLMTVKIKIIKWTDCWNFCFRYPNPPVFNERFMICAGTVEECKGNCKGDSGGPLTVLRNKEVTLVGVVAASTRSGCGTSTANYMNVASYREWIKKVTNLIKQDVKNKTDNQ
ncbi:serine proteinase stubble-like protein [Leptotrombidium deliense]|uniref:Serine proteinase stubble-like protein n=1 Tax=Leptotrombidium deliense TaxID=299467 RepID=A0A443S2Z9_9ACAR|nr:serine proteinase stubble-like protein [Leptotrombidium deliense]